MVSLSQSSKPVILVNIISVKAAAEYSGYSSQYLRRLLRLGKLAGLKLGQVWLIEMESFEWYLSEVENSQDHRFGPK
ncbi:MAG: helix-turn-helix domain-containing protein [Chloroflexi bacterium]|nr:helix-turn-helix domain-containing protein [Chloroflexota bacterium]